MGSENTVNVPSTLAELVTPAWLSAGLGQTFPGVNVTGVKMGSVATRISTNAFFEIECEGTVPDGLPLHLCAKGYFSDTGNWAYRSAGESEAHFYRLRAATTGVPTLPGVYADVDPESGHGVVITGDIAAAGATFVDPMDPRTTGDLASNLELYTTLHGRSWNQPWVQSEPWAKPKISTTRGVRSVEEIQSQFDGPLGEGVPKEAGDGAKLVEAYGSLPAITEASDSWCMIHGDAHIGNLFSDSEGRPGLLDWQLVQRGPWYIDIGYQIASSLAVDDRRNSDQDLLQHYLDGLAREGGSPPSAEEAQVGLCCGIVYGLYLWSITQKVRPEITAVLLGRLGTAAADHDAYDVVLAARP